MDWEIRKRVKKKYTDNECNIITDRGTLSQSSRVQARIEDSVIHGMLAYIAG